MAEYRGFDILDFLVLLNKRKLLLILLGIVTAISSYVLIFVFVEEQYDSYALIIPAEESGLGGLSSILPGVSDLPFDLGGLDSDGNIEKYETILYSRTTAEEMVNKFELSKDYKLQSMEKIIEAFQENLSTEETETGAYSIKIRANSPTKAADMVNYLVSYLNRSIIALNSQKSKENRQFLEKRYIEIKGKLSEAEDSLAEFSSKTGMYAVQDQIQSSFEAYTQLEMQIAKAEIEYSVTKQYLGENNPKVNNLKSTMDEMSKKLAAIKMNKDKESSLMPLSNLSEKSLEYLRLYRNVEIYNKMLEFIMPLYEQSRFEEQKNIPILQIIDEAIPPEKKSYPPRTLLTLVVVVLIEALAIFYLVLSTQIKESSNPQIIYLRNNFFSFRKKNV